MRRGPTTGATGQALAVSAALLGFSSAASALAGGGRGWIALWTTLATILPAVSTALAAYTQLYGFEQQSKIYADAIRGVHAAARRQDRTAAGPPAADGAAELVQRVESALRQEQAQWGQLTTRVQVADQTKGP